VSSYTSSSDPHRNYVLWLLALPLVLVAALFALGIHLQPLYGDLTRVGFFAEKDFGWNKPQLEFQHPLSSMGQYDRYHDVVVLGDSFSTGRPELHWQNYLGLATGWSVVTLDVNKITLDQVLANPVFRKTPPKLFILELVERDLPLVLKNQYQTCDATKVSEFPPSRAGAIHNLASTTMSARLEEITRFAKHTNRENAWRDINVGYVRGYVWNSLLRRLFGETHTPALVVDLSRPAPFSSPNKQALLLYRNDIRKAKWWRDMPMSEIDCRIEALHGKVEANRYTQFAFMVAPDKLTAYADYVRNKNYQNISGLAELLNHHPSIMPRLDLALISAIHKEEQDIYLPDDTHWGSSGNQIVAMTLLNFLQQ
jgi:hypothetical protein